eukprot:CAMPEP_0176477508 /NCGR_PEP_ID=MMETSP0200_2-20121128/661_1 /TAXON_ID=947934 /ORGANISM="Chaetoceros sp., Strain GSL56" /LENGTH=1340 /DNA_ID=CAMNT_0017873325 /DNA_START=343 /DNA_END=4365 /DNA_ORIENTATION=+
MTLNNKYSSPHTFFTREIYCKAKLPSLLTAITEQKDDARQFGSSKPSTPREMIVKFQSYATNISRTRKITTTTGQTPIVGQSSIIMGNGKDMNQGVRNIPSSIPIMTKQYPASMTAVRSLLYTLTQETTSLSGCMEQGNLYTYPQDVMMELRNSINHALIQALRACSDHGDYIMISKLVQGAISYSEVVARVLLTDGDGKDGHRQNVSREKRRYMTRLLEARFFGEAIFEMGRTKAGNSKLNKLWLTFMDVSRSLCEWEWELELDENEGNSSFDSVCILASKPSAFELNAMISALGSRGKVRAALNLYHEIQNDVRAGRKTFVEYDEYTASALLNVLAESIESDHYSSESPVGNSAVGGSSPCWQWNEALSILDDFEKNGKINNHVYCAALQVNEQAMISYRFPGNKHPGSKYSMSILERMKANGISPDVITCSYVLSTFDKGKQWKASLALLQAMEKLEQENESSGAQKMEWMLPAPNVYSYASVISCCARAGQYNETISLLDRIRTRTTDVNSILRPNIWMYNSALASCVPSPKNNYKTNKCKIEIASQILQRMEEDCRSGFDCMPDIVTYNTLLSVIRGISQDNVKNNSFNDFIVIKNADTDSEYGHEHLVMDIMDTMAMKNIPKDPGTYHNAIISCELHPKSALNILDRALADSQMLERGKDDGWGSLDRVRLYMINSALSVCSANGNMSLVSKIFGYIKTFNLKADSDSMMSVVKCLPAGGNSDDSMMVLNAMKGDGAANSQCIEKYGIDVIGSGITTSSPIIEERHYSAAIAGCLRYGRLFAALKILNAMKLHDLRPNSTSLQGIILAYCKLATDEATLEFREARKQYAKSKTRGPAFSADHTTSRTRANAALAMMRSLQDAPVKLKCVVASACAATGMWYEARDILWNLHISAVREKKRENSIKVIDQDQGSALAELPRLHRSLLKLCARSGNVTAALSFVDTIQDLKSKLENGSSMHIDDLPNRSALFNETNTFATMGSTVPLVSPLQHGIGMTGEDWKLLIIAASKSAHWKVCVGTLAFLQPYVEATHPKHASRERGKSSMTRLNKEYDKLSRALTAAVLAFEIRSQYAWALRSIYDWIEWSGRRPPREAIFAACRILATRGISSEITSLVTKVIQMKDFSKNLSNVLSFETSYEMAIYIEAISLLYNHGLYDAADELYVDAISKAFLPFSIMEETTSSQFKIDLHGMNRAVAHSAVRVSLQHFIQSKKVDRVERDVLIITGRGNSSQKHLRPVLRPEVQRMLMEEFYPPISTSSLPNNMGALKISSHDINGWIKHQEEEKGARFLAMAGVLKSITSGSRLKKLLSRNLQRFPSSSESPSLVEDKSDEVNL